MKRNDDDAGKNTQDALERSIPSLSPSTSSSSSDGQAASDQTLSLRQLRSLLSDLHHLTTERDSLIAEGKYAMSAASGDDAVAKRAIIEESERLIRAKGERGGGGGVEEQIGLQEFEEVIEGQLGKFKGFGKRMKELLARGEDLLDSIKVRLIPSGPRFLLPLTFEVLLRASHRRPTLPSCTTVPPPLCSCNGNEPCRNWTVPPPCTRRSSTTYKRASSSTLIWVG